MPTTPGPQIRTVADIVQTVLKCSKENANAAEREICKSPTNIQKLALACSIPVAAVGAGGKLFQVGFEYGGFEYGGFEYGGLAMLPGIAAGTAGFFNAKRFCSAMLKRSMSIPV